MSKIVSSTYNDCTSRMPNSAPNEQPDITMGESTMSPVGRIRKITLRVKVPAVDSASLEVGMPLDPATAPLSSLVAVPRKAKAPPPPLHEHQERAIHAVLKSFKNGRSRIGVSAPTGSGKTAIFVSMIPFIPSRSGEDKVLILVPSVEILKQVVIETRRRLPDYRVDEEQGPSHADVASVDIIVATWQSMLKMRIQKYEPSLFKCVIVDEAHHSAADSYLRQLHYFHDTVILRRTLKPFRALRHGSQVPIIGFSGTMARDDGSPLGMVFEEVDGRPLGMVFEEVVFHLDNADLVRDGFLSPFNVVSALEDVRKLLGQDSKFPLWTFAQTERFFLLVVRAYRQYAEGRKSTLVFCASVGAVKEITGCFNAADISARCVSQHTSRTQRKEIIDDFKAGRFPVLVNCQIYTEGADIPQVDAVFLASPIHNLNGIVQMAGRGTRDSPDTDKSDCLMLDFFNIRKPGSLSVDPVLWPEDWKHWLPDGPEGMNRM